jgi:hypothetical protein
MTCVLACDDGRAVLMTGVLTIMMCGVQVRQCNRCTITFTLMRRKHHCRRSEPNP